MTKKKQEQQELNQDEHVTAVLDKRTNKTAVISKMNEQDGSIEVVPPNKKNNNSFSNRTVPHLWNCSSRISKLVPKSYKLQFLPCTTCCFGQDTKRGHPDSEGGSPRTERLETGRKQRTQRRGTYRQTDPAV